MDLRLAHAFSRSDRLAERNEHNLLRDFSDEVPGYLHNAAMAHALEELDLKSGKNTFSENLFRCYQTLTERAGSEKKSYRW